MSYLDQIAAALDARDFSVRVGAGHLWEKEVDKLGLEPRRLLAALEHEGFDPSGARNPVVCLRKAAEFARFAAAAEKKREPVYDWRGSTLIRKPRGHVCDRDATCADHWAYKAKADGREALLCAYHYRTETPKWLFNDYWDALAPDREATSKWADEIARAFSKMPRMPRADEAPHRMERAA